MSLTYKAIASKNPKYFFSVKFANYWQKVVTKQAVNSKQKKKLFKIFIFNLKFII